jgi:glutaminyl-tRNA synthetase
MQYADKGYKRFAKNQPVGLRHAGLVISCKQVITDKKGHVTEIIALCSKGEHAAKPKGFIHWVSDPMKIEVRLYDRL